MVFCCPRKRLKYTAKPSIYSQPLSVKTQTYPTSFPLPLPLPSSNMSKETKRKLTRFITADNVRSLFPTRKKDAPNLQAPEPSERPTSADIPVINVLSTAEKGERNSVQQVLKRSRYLLRSQAQQRRGGRPLNFT